MAELRLICAVYGGAVFPVQTARDAEVSALKKAIFAEKRYEQRYSFDASDMTLYVARKNNSWLKKEDAEPVLRGPVDTEYRKMLTTRRLDHAAYFGDVSMSEREVIHVLVELPSGEPEIKRQRAEETTAMSLADVWLNSQLSLDASPAVHELRALLLKPLPFRLTLWDRTVSMVISDPHGPLRQCELSSLMDAFVASSNLPPAANASKNTWQRYYDALFLITHALCSSKGLHLDMRRNQAETTGTTTPLKRPDFLLLDKYLVLMRGEEKSALMDITVSIGELTNKMRRWNVILYGDLPYILGYATSGDKLQLVAIERSDSPRCTSLLTVNILREKAVALKLFFNLAFVLYEMASLTNRSYACGLQPFVPDINDKRRIELLDGVIQRTVTKQQCSDPADFARLTNVYTVLRSLGAASSSVTHLQTVDRLKVKKTGGERLVVNLSPIGHLRLPTIDEVGECVRDVLTALKFWHGCNYCHGDLRWRNIVLVLPAASSNWMLIDMDESHRPNTVTIRWNHPMSGHKLRFQHDLYQVGALLMQLPYELPKEIKRIQARLLSAVDTPGFSAEAALVELQTALEHSENRNVG